MREIKSIDPSSFAKIFGAIFFGLTLLWIIPVDFLLFMQAIKGNADFGGILFIWIFLLINPGFGYLFGTLIAYVYNISAKKIGGIIVEFDAE